MSRRSAHALLVLLLLLYGETAAAAINCSISSPGFSATYTGALSINQTYLTLNCNRLAGDPSTSAYSIRPDNGLNASGQQNRAVLGSYFISYEDYLDSTCTTLWRSSGGGGSSAISGTVNFGTALSVAVQRDFWSCIPAGQSYAAGVYTDNVTMTLTYDTGSGNTTATGTHAVLINTPAACSITTAPGNLHFSYTALQLAPTTASTAFSANCTILGSYSMSVTPARGVVSGLHYSLLLNTIASSGSNPLASTGTGNQQTFFINGTMPGSQAGVCALGSCVDASTHTLTLTF